MEAVRTSETSVNFNVTTRRYIPEYSKLLFPLLSIFCIHTSAVFPITHSVMYGPAFRATYSDIHVLTYPFGKCRAFLFKIVFMGMCQLHTNGSFCVEQRVAYFVEAVRAFRECSLQNITTLDKLVHDLFLVMG
jgi:hypothetical protein